jgi:hypothetical protein
MKLSQPATGILTDAYKISPDKIAVLSEPIRPTVTRFRQVGVPVDPEEPEPFIRIRRSDGITLKPGLYEYTTMGETYSVEHYGEVGCFVLGVLRTT